MTTKNVIATLEKINVAEVQENEKINKFFKWCEEEYGLTDLEKDDIMEIFFDFSRDSKCHYETLVSAYIIMIDDMKSVMKERLSALISYSTNRIQESKELLDNWEKIIVENQQSIEKEITAAKEMLNITQNFLEFCKDYK